MIILNELNFSSARELRKKNTPKEVEQYLTDNGFEFESEGAQAAVFGKKGSNIVVRYMNHRDRCWLKFYEFAYANQRKNPHLPRIGKLKALVDDCYLVFMERLKPLEDDYYYEIYRNRNTKEFKEFFKLVEHLEKNLTYGCRMDLTQENIMVRPSTDEPVVIDPYN